MSLFSNSPEPSQAEAFQEVLRLYGTMAYRMALQITGGREAESSDLVQEAFLKIWNNWSVQRPSSIKGWMYRVLNNLYIDAVRRKTRHPMVSMDEPHGSILSWEDTLPDGAPSAQEVLEQRDVQKSVARALAKMDVDFRIPVVLCDMEGLAYEDIARILSCPIGTVRSRIHRGRMQLRQILQSMPLAEVML